jgi:hypothetical protein
MPVLCWMRVEINFIMSGADNDPVPTPHIQVGFLISQQPTSSEPDAKAILLSRF